MADQDYKLCPFMTLTVMAEDYGEGAVCAKEHCAWYDEDAEMCVVPMLSCSMWEIVRLLQRRKGS